MHCPMRSAEPVAKIGSFHEEQIDVLFMLDTEPPRLNIHLIYTVEHIKIVLHTPGARISFHRGRNTICPSSTPSIFTLSRSHQNRVAGFPDCKGEESPASSLLMGIMHPRCLPAHTRFRSRLTTCFKLHFKTSRLPAPESQIGVEDRLYIQDIPSGLSLPLP